MIAPRRPSAVALLGLSASALLLGCGGDAAQPASATQPSFPLSITARGESREPLAGVQISLRAELLGTTDRNGLLRLELEGAEGDRAALGVVCPPSFASPASPLVVGLRHLSAASAPPSFEVECAATVHSFVVGISAEHGARLPILLLTEPIGQTDELGVAHVLVRAPSEENVSLTLDTSERPDLLPQNPTLTFVASDRAELLLLEQKFVEKKAPPPRRPRLQIPQQIGPRG